MYVFQFETELKRMTEALIIKYNPEKIYLLGDMLNLQNLKESSVIQLIVVIKESDTLALDRIFEALKLLQPRVTTDIDVFTIEELNRSREEDYLFQNEINKASKVIYEKIPA